MMNHRPTLLIPQKKVVYDDCDDDKSERGKRRPTTNMTMKTLRSLKKAVLPKKDPKLVATTVNGRAAVVRVLPIEERLVVLALPAAVAQHGRPVPQPIVRTKAALGTINNGEAQVHQVQQALLPRPVRQTSKAFQTQIPGIVRRNVILLALPCHLLPESSP